MNAKSIIFFYKAAFILAVAAIFTEFYYKADSNILYHADSLYTAYIHHELFTENQYLKEIKFTPSPYFFPDLIIYSVIVYFLNIFFTENLFISQYLYSLIQIALLGGLTLWLIRLSAKKDTPAESQTDNRSDFLSSAFYLVLSLSVPILAYRFPPLSVAFLPGVHFSLFIIILFQLGLSIQLSERRGHDHLKPDGITDGIIYLILFITGVHISISDPLYNILMLPLPAALVISHFMRKSRELRTDILSASVLILSAACGYITYRYIKSYINISEVPIDLSLSNLPQSYELIKNSFNIWWGHIIMMISGSALTFFLLLLGLISWIFSGFAILPKQSNKNINIFFLWYFLFTPLSWLSAPLSGTYKDLYSLRYTIFPLFLSLPVAASSFSTIFTGSLKLKIKSIKETADKNFSIFINENRYLNIFASLLLITLFSAYSFIKIMSFEYYPEDLKCAHTHLENQPIKIGTGNFWSAMRITLLSKQFSKNDYIRIYKPDDKRLSAYPEPLRKIKCDPFELELYIYK
jgi:hypothetical protein